MLKLDKGTGDPFDFSMSRGSLDGSTASLCGTLSLIMCRITSFGIVSKMLVDVDMAYCAGSAGWCFVWLSLNNVVFSSSCFFFF